MGKQSFIPGGMIATAAQAVAAGRVRSAGTRRRRKKKSKRTSGSTRRASGARRSRGKPRPGTKAWMTYIRGMRKKKRK